MTRLHFGANDVTSTEKGEGAHRVWLSGWSLVVLCLILPTHSYTQNSFDDLPILDLDTPIRMNFAGNWEKDFGRSDNWEDELSRRMSIRQENAALQRSGIGLGRARPNPMPDLCSAAFSCRIDILRLSSSSQLSLRPKSFSQFPAKFMRIGVSRSKIGRSSKEFWVYE